MLSHVVAVQMRSSGVNLTQDAKVSVRDGIEWRGVTKYEKESYALERQEMTENEIRKASDSKVTSLHSPRMKVTTSTRLGSATPTKNLVEVVAQALRKMKFSSINLLRKGGVAPEDANANAVNDKSYSTPLQVSARS